MLEVHHTYRVRRIFNINGKTRVVLDAPFFLYLKL
jgi:hypothetical protein